jgi:hypothetical protein
MMSWKKNNSCSQEELLISNHKEIKLILYKYLELELLMLFKDHWLVHIPIKLGGWEINN